MTKQEIKEKIIEFKTDEEIVNFINPKKKVLAYLEKELQDYHLSTTMIFVNA